MKKIILPLLLIFLASCKSDSTSTSGNTNTTAAANQWILTVNGTRYVWQAYASKLSLPGTTQIYVNSRDTATFMDKVASFGFSNISVGTYDIGVVNVVGGLAQFITPGYTAHDTTDYSTPDFQSVPVGKMIITELTDHSLKATFNETLTKVRGVGDSTVTIMEGSVNVTFP